MENREMIMRCAKTLFYAKGYDAVGVQEIVDKAGVTKPTLYYYFGSKLGLLKTLIEETFQCSCVSFFSSLAAFILLPISYSMSLPLPCTLL